MSFYIHKSILGTTKSLVFNEDEFFWSSTPSADYSLGNTSEDVRVEDLAILLGKDLDLTIGSEPQVRAFTKCLGLSKDEICWPMALSPENFRNRVQKINSNVSEIICDYEKTNYDKTYRVTRKFLRGLSRASIDSSKIRNYIEECVSGPSVISTLKSFLPTKGESLASPIEYTHVSTSTGRLVVKSGPSILTLPAANRDILKSSTGGKIFQVDFVSLEPRVVLYLMGSSAPDDIYSHIQTKLFHDHVDRKTVKLATLSALYGSSYKSLSKLTGSDQTSKNLIKRVREYFNLHQLEAVLTDIMQGQGQIMNHFGRPLRIDDPRPNILVSHFVQSTAVDTALLGFNSLMKVLTPLKVKPIYVIHDAVVVDVPKDAIDKFNEMCDKGVDLELGHFKFDVTQLCSK